MNHFHVIIMGEAGPGVRHRGALCTTQAAAEQEQRIEEEGNRKVDIEGCAQACWAQSPLIQNQH